MALTDNLLAFWELEEVSGARLDAVSLLSLTDNNTVTQATGKVGNAALFTAANSEYLSATDAAAAALRFNDHDFTIQAWTYLEEVDSGPCLVSKHMSAAREYYMRITDSGSGRVATVVFSCGDALTVEGVSSVGIGAFGTDPLVIHTWFCIHGWYDAANNQVGISINAGTAVLSATLGNAFGSPGAVFHLGNTGDNSLPLDGRLDQVGLWNRVLTSGERTSLYNAGAGLSYSAMGGAPPAGGGEVSAGRTTTRGVARGVERGVSQAPIKMVRKDHIYVPERIGKDQPLYLPKVA